MDLDTIRPDAIKLDAIKSEVEAAVPGSRMEIIANPSPSAQHSLLIDASSALAIARYLRDAPALRFDYCSNVTGIDFPPKELSEKLKVKKLVDGPNGPEEKEVDEVRKTSIPGFLEVVYHLFSVAHRHGPVILRLRTADRDTGVRLPSLTPVWRAAELQEREIFDLYGVIFDGHPDLRRLLMWDDFKDHPMRRDYVEPDDYEYEPTAHDEVLERANRHAAQHTTQQAAPQAGATEAQ
jgi:NADH-quinone oxidoreductase subunit C